MVGFPYVKRYTLDEHIARTIGDYKGEQVLEGGWSMSLANKY